MKICTRCNEDKELECFRFEPYRQKYINACRQCMTKYRHDWRVKHREKQNQLAKAYHKKHPTANRTWFLKRLYGMTNEDYIIMLTKQNNKCNICRVDANAIKKRLEVDHNHITGKVRGLLCHKCNKALGLLKTDEGLELMLNAIDYLGGNYVR